jgi:hypothetical protein
MKTAIDIPVTGNWNGDGIDTIGMYRNGGVPPHGGYYGSRESRKKAIQGIM